MSIVTDVLNKLKLLPQARISQFVVALLLIYIASILANISWMLIPGGATPAQITAPGGKANNQSAKSGGASFNVSSLTSVNLFGSFVAPTQEVAVVEQTVSADAPETKLNLTLAATVAEGKNSGRGTAIIQSGGTQGTYGIDDKIDSTTAIVKQVFTDRVIIQNGPNRETLMLDGVEYDKMNVARDVETPRPNQLNKPKTQNRNNNDSRANTVDKRRDTKLSNRLALQRESLQRDPKKLFDLIRFSPERKGGELAGYRLNPGEQPDLFKQAGFRPNDLAVEVNGIPLNNIQQAMMALKAFRELTEANIVVERDGIRTEILFSMDSGDNARRDAPPSKKRDGRLN